MEAQTAVIAGTVAAAALIAMTWTAVSHYREHGHLALNVGALAMAGMFGAVAFLSGRGWWRKRSGWKDKGP